MGRNNNQKVTSEYYSDNNSWYNLKHCGGNHYECNYFCNGGKPNVGVYAKKKGEQE